MAIARPTDTKEAQVSFMNSMPWQIRSISTELELEYRVELVVAEPG